MAVRLVALVVAVAALIGLVVGAVNGVRSADADARPSSVAGAQLEDAYYSCLSTQAHSLVRPGQTVAIPINPLADFVTLAKVVTPWTPITFRPTGAAAVFSLRTSRSPGACLGTVVVARYPDGRVRRGTGASLPGRGPLPVTPL